jgi:hypothetical protein
VNAPNALAIAFAASLLCSPTSGAAQGFLHSHPDQHHPPLQQKMPAAHRRSATGASTQGAPTLETSSPRPLVTNDSDGLSRDPEECNKGCLDSSE